MRVLLTGGCGDLGKVLARRLTNRGDEAVLLDVADPPHDSPGEFVRGSVLDRPQLPTWFSNCDVVVHIAAWHGIHEFKKQRDAYEFFDLNIRGTFEVFEASVRAGVGSVIFISSTSIDEPDTVYGNSKIISEQLASFYASHHKLKTITLRPRAFIPHWNRAVYSNYVEWAKWFWKGAVHINDVAQSVERSIDYLARRLDGDATRSDEESEDAERDVCENLILTVDGAYEYSKDEFLNWDREGPGTTFKLHFPEYYEMALKHDLPLHHCPRRLDISRTTSSIGYVPQYSVRNLLEELSKYGASGPPI